MNISLKRSDDAVSGVLKVEVVKADYADQVEKGLRSYRQKAEIHGFRKGMAPMGMIRKMYGKAVAADEVNKIVPESIVNYIRENDVAILGEPLPSGTEQPEIDFEARGDCEFYFDVALAPEVNIVWTKEDKLPYYQVTVDDEMLEKQIESFRENYGILDDTSETVEEKDLIKGVVTELEDDGSPKEGGMVVEDAILMPLYIKDEEERNKFIGAGKNSTVTFNPAKAYDGAVAEIASFLKTDKSEAGSIVNDFTFEIKEITHHRKAEMDQEFFDKVFGEGNVTTEEEFRNKLRESIRGQFTPQSDAKFFLDARKLLLEKAGNMNFADDILKRQLMVSGENRTAEKLEEEYPQIIEDLKFQLIKKDLVKKNAIKVTDEDVLRLARRFAQSQLAQYGMYSVPAESLDNYAREMLKNEQTRRDIIDHATDDKLTVWLKDGADLDIKEVSSDDLNKLFREENNK
ncbi:MAG: trigger factor [Tannerellaceae bacterium]|jgi:trigger factor|nr:trigger factor [Tannerellaceae bacterium]